MRNFRTFNTAVDFYHLSCELQLPCHLREQLSRAALSIPLNLAEARGKTSCKDQLRFFSIAMGSLRECQAILIIANLEGTKAWEMLDKTAAQLYRLLNQARS